jgi:hypothetical protein
MDTYVRNHREFDPKKEEFMKLRTWEKELVNLMKTARHQIPQGVAEDVLMEVEPEHSLIEESFKKMNLEENPRPNTLIEMLFEKSQNDLKATSEDSFDYVYNYLCNLAVSFKETVTRKKFNEVILIAKINS